MRTWLVVIVSILLGWAITYLDAGLSSDQTSITALLVVVCSGVIAFFNPIKPWFWALLIGIWIPIVGVFIRHDFGGVLALVVAFIGAYSGYAMRTVRDRTEDQE